METTKFGLLLRELAVLGLFGGEAFGLAVLPFGALGVMVGCAILAEFRWGSWQHCRELHVVGVVSVDRPASAARSPPHVALVLGQSAWGCPFG